MISWTIVKVKKMMKVIIKDKNWYFIKYVEDNIVEVVGNNCYNTND